MLGMMILSLPVAVIMVVTGVVGGTLIFGWPLVLSMGPVAWGVQNENILTAVPLFILLGELLLRSGLADRMYTALAVWFVRLPGGLLHTNIGASAMFAATSGSSVATAATIGTVALPNLMKRGYSPSRSLGSLAAGGTLGILIPPSVNLLIYGSLAETSIGQLFIAGIIPGAAADPLFHASHRRAEPRSAPTRAQQGEERAAASARAACADAPSRAADDHLPGGDGLDLSRHRHAHRIGGALRWSSPLGFIAVTGRLTVALLDTCFRQSAKTTGMILLIVAAAFMLNVTLAARRGGTDDDHMGRLVRPLGDVAPAHPHRLLPDPRHVHGRPLHAGARRSRSRYPMVTAVGVDPIWFGIFVVLMCEVAMITPPVGMNLYVVQGVRHDRGAIRRRRERRRSPTRSSCWSSPCLLIALPRTRPLAARRRCDGTPSRTSSAERLAPLRHRALARLSGAN